MLKETVHHYINNINIRQKLVVPVSLRLRSLHTDSEIFACVFLDSSSFPIKMLAMDMKMQKIEPDPFFLLRTNFDGQKFRKQCVNVIDTT